MKIQFVRVLKLSAAIIALALPLFGQQDAAFFRIISTTNSEITAFSGGTMVWTNAAVENVTCVVQRAGTLIGPDNWMDYVQHGVTNDVMALRLFDPVAPSDMGYIPAGSFSMGDNLDGYADAQPVHSVYVSAFYMGKTEVTKAQWDEVYIWAVTNGYSFTNAGSGKASSHPVQTVNWYDTVKWCNARSEKEDKPPCYTVDGNVYRTGQSEPDCNWSAAGYRLPSEAEWEKAARGGLSGKRFPWGDTIQHTKANYYSDVSYSYDTSATRGYHPSYDDAPYPYTSPAGSFAPNGYGLYDMTGNVWEWCWDWYGGTYYASSPSSNPHGAAAGFFRVWRGGDWDYYARRCRVAFRFYGIPDFADYGTPDRAGGNPGIRVVLSAGQ